MGCYSSSIELYPKDRLNDGPAGTNCVALSPDNSLLLTGSEDCQIRLWSTKTEDPEIIRVLKGHEKYITCLSIHDEYAVAGAADGSIRKWNMGAHDDEPPHVYTGHTGSIRRVICTDQFVFSSSSDKTTKVWLFKENAELEHPDEVQDTSSGLLRTFAGHKLSVSAMIFIPGASLPDTGRKLKLNPSDLLLTASADSTIKTWSFGSSKALKTFTGHKGPVTCMMPDSGGHILYSGSDDRTIRSWNISTGLCLRVMEGHTKSILCLTVVNKLVYTGSSDGSARCWVTDFGDCTRVYLGHMHSISCIKFYKTYIFTGCGDCLIRAFDTRSGALKFVFKGHQDGVTSMVVVDDSMYSASSGGELILWDLKPLDDASTPNSLPGTQQGKNLAFQEDNIKDLQHDLEGYSTEL